MVSHETIQLLLPEIVMVITATWVYLAGAFVPSRRAMIWYAGIGLAVAAMALFRQSSVAFEPPQNYGPVGMGAFGYLVRWLGIIVAYLFVLTSAGGRRGGPAPESVGSLLLVNAGLMLLAAADELILVFLALELISIPTYILLFLGRRDAACQEATVKYFFLSILASAMLLYGFSFVYGIAGTTQLSGIAAAVDANPAFESLAPLAFVLVVAGLSFKIAAVPLHFYAPDVYEGAGNLNAGVLAVVPKIAGIVALIRIATVLAPVAADTAWQLFLLLAMLTMTFGNVLALWQRNLRRLLAYSSIAHAGYMLIGLAVWMASRADDGIDESVGQSGLSATLLYLVVYAVASLGTFAALVCLNSEEKQIDEVSDLSGLSRSRRGAALMIALFMLSLAGLPPLAGFWGKLSLFAGALNVRSGESGLFGTSSVQNWFLILAVVGVLNAAVSAAYYLRVVAAMHFGNSNSEVPATNSLGGSMVSSCCAALVVVIGLYPGPLVCASREGARSAEMISKITDPVTRPEKDSLASERQ
jgi:NADH-quinone oxidoreductase subunit N